MPPPATIYDDADAAADDVAATGGRYDVTRRHDDRCDVDMPWYKAAFDVTTSVDDGCVATTASDLTTRLETVL